MMSVAELLGEDGPLARHLAGFAPRPQQQEMAGHIAAVLEEGGTLVTEAGTGTGKTLAYLVPALRSGRKIIISTATKTLQEQLYHRDIPLVRKALSAPLRYAMLKGRGNYLCRYRLQLAQQAGSDRAPQYAVHYRRIRAWAARTEQGDIEELSGIPEDSPVWRQVTSSGDNCLGQECPDFSACHVMKARRAAQEADLLVINHHLLFSDMMLKEGGFGELLPGADGFIIDEAHQLPEIASRFFGSAVSGNQFLEVGRDVAKAGHLEGGDMPQLPELVLALEQAVRGLRTALGADSRRAPWRAVRGEGAVQRAMAALQDSAGRLAAMLEQVAERGK
ncbi:MAG: ATP-dependent DNA helicase, partial [Gammaproteobacteria bacterium]